MTDYLHGFIEFELSGKDNGEHPLPIDKTGCLGGSSGQFLETQPDWRTQDVGDDQRGLALFGKGPGSFKLLTALVQAVACSGNDLRDGVAHSLDHLNEKRRPSSQAVSSPSRRKASAARPSAKVSVSAANS